MGTVAGPGEFTHRRSSVRSGRAYQTRAGIRAFPADNEVRTVVSWPIRTLLERGDDMGTVGVIFDSIEEFPTHLPSRLAPFLAASTSDVQLLRPGSRSSEGPDDSLQPP